MRRRPLATLVTLVLTLSLGGASHARSIQEIVGLRWVGMSTQPADFTESGKVYVRQTLSMTMDASNRLSGSLTSTLTLDGSTYQAGFGVFGSYDPSAQAIDIRTSPGRSDSLPHGLRWCNLSGRLRFYNDADRSGHFVLKGTLDVSCGGTAEFELSDQ